VSDDERVRAGIQRRRDERSKRLRSTVVLVRAQTCPPSVMSSMACGSLPLISRAVSTARKKRLEYDFPV